MSGIVAKRVSLARRGHEHVGLCPFHDEKTPSFTVSDQKGFYHCFGCQEHGSVFDFVMKTEGIDFIAAVEQLAREAGLEMPAFDRARGTRDQGARDSLYDLMEKAAAWFENQLSLSGGAEARAYLKGRGLNDATLGQFRVGFAPDSRGTLKRALLTGGHSEHALAAAGLVAAPEEGSESYDRFRNRIMFPITDARGRVIAFGGRALGEARAKYLNSPETSLFHKGSVLYHLPEARAAAREAGSVTVVEGYMDVVALSQAGFTATVAPMGTALTERQLAELWRLTAEPVLCMDGDAAGSNAAQRAAHRALPELRPGHSLRFAVMPPGEDPDSLVRGSDGSERFQTALNDAKPLADVLWGAAAAGDFSTPERRAGLRKTVFDLAAGIREATVREYYRRFFATKLDDLFGPAPSTARGPRAGRRSRPWPGHKIRAADGPGGKGGPESRWIREQLAAVLNHPEILEQVFEDLSRLPITDPDLDKLSSEIEKAWAAEVLDRDGLHAHLKDRGLAEVAHRLNGPRAGLGAKYARPEATPEEAAAGWRETMALHHRAVGRETERQAQVKDLGEHPTEEKFARLRAHHAEEERDETEDTLAAAGT